ncbi:MAG: hypothetical protein K0R28_4011 [Paenibacillus sp.]|jgi:hypothetical protein|nr:hypothetical protein [Paenibacillus sp.]
MTNLNFTTEDGNDGAMFPETIPPTLLLASWLTGHGVSNEFDRFIVFTKLAYKPTIRH